MTTPASGAFAFVVDPRPGYWLGYFDALSESLTPAIEVEADSRIEGDLLRLAAWRGYKRVGEVVGEDGEKMWLFNLREPLEQIEGPDDGEEWRER